jgi:methylaspartate ammonia-lyase
LFIKRNFRKYRERLYKPKMTRTIKQGEYMKIEKMLIRKGLGGSFWVDRAAILKDAETERSAQICAQVALATQPCQILAKPGHEVVEAVSIALNEMQRVLAIIDNRSSKKRLAV